MGNIERIYIFNEITKRQYIKEKSEKVIISDYYLERRFKQTAKYENELKKDLSNFTYDEIINFYKILYLIFNYPHKHYTFKHFEV